jgi:hypothetical protein
MLLERIVGAGLGLFKRFGAGSHVVQIRALTARCLIRVSAGQEHGM